MPPQNSQSSGLPPGYTLDAPASPAGLPAGYSLDTPAPNTPAGGPSTETANDRLFKGMGTEPATISAAPTGVNAWLQNAENDFRRGGQSTIIGKMLHAAGANPNGVDSGTGSYAADTVASLPLGLLHAAQGVAQTPEHPVAGPLHAIGGVLQAATIPAAFAAPETQALKDASAASQVRQALLPTKDEAGKLFQPIAAAAKSTPVDTAPARAIAEEAKQYNEAGTTLPPMLRKFLAKTANDAPMNPQSPMFYPEARRFAENAGRMSASDRLALNPQMDRLVGKFAGALKDANRAAAEEVGMGAQYDQAMSRYRTASQLDALKQNAVKYATGAIVGGLGADALYRLISSATTKKPGQR